MTMTRAIRARLGACSLFFCTLGALGALGALVASASAPAHAASDPDYERGRATATALANAFANGQAKAYRLAAAGHLRALDGTATPALSRQLAALVDVAIERGAQGLEGALTSTVAALAARDPESWVTARNQLARLAPRFRIVSAVRRPNAMIAVSRPGNPLVGYYPVKLARQVLQGQLATGVVDVEGALSNLCSERELARVEAENGRQIADALRAMCNDRRAGGGGGAGLGGELDLGYAGDLSLVDCIQGHDETRAEKIDRLMKACQESLMAVGEDANPLAVSPTWSGDRPPFELAPMKSKKAEEVGDDIVITYFDDLFSQGNGNRVMKVKTDHMKTTTTFYERGVPKFEETVDEVADTTTLSAWNDDGSYEKVTIYADNSYEVERRESNGKVYRQKYDAKGNPVSAGTSPVPDLGRTAQCRELTIAMMREGTEGALESQGIDPRVVNPNPEAPAPPTATPSDLDCLGFAAGPQLDQSFGCVNDLVLCPEGQFRDAACNCKTRDRGVMPSTQCGIYMLCADGLPPAQQDGTCTCGDADEVFFVDEGLAPGPRPAPIDLDAPF